MYCEREGMAQELRIEIEKNIKNVVFITQNLLHTFFELKYKVEEHNFIFEIVYSTYDFNLKNKFVIMCV